MGGENWTQSSGNDTGKGSSPRGRGKPVYTGRRVGPVGLIPAWAGKTTSRLTWTRPAPAHPRVGGENRPLEREAQHNAGSSPRGRGKRPACRECPREPRLIPAWAGKTGWQEGRRAQAWAHPRVGGENTPAARLPATITGSSPRGRGKPGNLAAGVRTPRLIPAWAGKTGNMARELTARGAHPRVGGENGGLHYQGLEGGGSSPRGRGKRDGRPECLRARRLIPAWAGKTSTTATSRSPARAHPRVGGENASYAQDLLSCTGSSPRGRGKRTAPWAV